MTKPACVLVFPPVWEAAAPYLAGPALAAYLRQAGHVAHVIDANNLFWNHFRRDLELGRKVYQRCADGREDLSLSLEEGAAAHQTAEQSFEQFKAWFQGVSIASPRYELLVRTFGGFRRIPPQPVDESLRYHDKYFGDISLSHASTNSLALRECVVDDPANPWRVFAREHILPRIERQQRGLLGITMAAPNHVVPAFSLAMEARLAWPTMSIAFGGPWVTHLRKRIRNVEWFKEWRFLFVPFQGEAVLAEMMEAVESGRDPAPIAQRSLVSDEPLCRVSMQDLPPPDFSDLPLDEYTEPGHLPLTASRGCYWAKCEFCSYPLLEPRYEVRSESRLGDAMETLVQKHGAHHLAFTDPSLSAPLGRTIARIVHQRDLKTTWGALARLDAAFDHAALKEMADGGCTALHWGLESGSERILQAMIKGLDFPTVERVLKTAADCGIHSRMLMMYAFPDEAEADLEATFSLIERNLPVIGSVCWSRCTVELDTGLAGSASDSDGGPQDADLELGTVVVPPYGAKHLVAAEERMGLLSARAVLDTRARVAPRQAGPDGERRSSKS